MFQGMKARELLGSGTAPDGSELTLWMEGPGPVVRIGNEVLMSSRLHGSEQAMVARCVDDALRSTKPRVLVGGLGMGFTLRATLDVLPPNAEVVVAELFPCVVDWCRGPLASLSEDALSDPRVRVEVGDVQKILRSPGSRFDCILLDVDNGPDALVTLGNRTIYTQTGLFTIAAALRPGGAVGFWSATGSRTFEKTISRAGLKVEVHKLDARHDRARGGMHTLFIGRAPKEKKTGPAPAPPAKKKRPPGRAPGPTSRR